MCHADRDGGGGGGEGGSINHWLSPEPKVEGTCNFIYLVRKVPLSFMPNYSYREKKSSYNRGIGNPNITFHIFVYWIEGFSLEILIIDYKDLPETIFLWNTHMSVSFVYRCVVYLENGLYLPN